MKTAIKHILKEGYDGYKNSAHVRDSRDTGEHHSGNGSDRAYIAPALPPENAAKESPLRNKLNAAGELLVILISIAAALAMVFSLAFI